MKKQHDNDTREIVKMDQTNDLGNPDAEQERLSRHLREAREYLGMSQEFVADYLKVPRAAVSLIESNKRKVSGVELKQLSRLYRRPMEYFLGEEHEEPLQDETFAALFRTAKALNDEDRTQVLRFAEFLRSAGRAPKRNTQPPDEHEVAP